MSPAFKSVATDPDRVRTHILEITERESTAKPSSQHKILPCRNEFLGHVKPADERDGDNDLCFHDNTGLKQRWSSDMSPEKH